MKKLSEFSVIVSNFKQKASFSEWNYFF